MGAIGVALTVTATIVGLSSQSRLGGPNRALGTPDPLRVLELRAYSVNPLNPTYWEVGVDLAGCCWSDRVIHAAIHQGDVDSRGFAGYGYTDPDIELLQDGSLNPGITIKFAGYFHAGTATITVCDSRRCAKTDVMVPEAQPAP